MKVSFAAMCITFGIFALNDICDEEVDRINKPDRPIPSGRISRADVMGLALALFAIGIITASYLNSIAVLLILIYLLIGVAYSVDPPRLKKGLSNYLCMAFATAILVLFGASVVQITNKAVFEAAGMFLFMVACSPVKDMKDVKGDRVMGIRTLPVRIGEEKAIKVITVNTVLTFPIFFSGYLFYSFNPLYLLTLIVGAIICTKNLRWTWRNSRDRAKCERALVKVISSSMIILLAFILGSISS